MAWKKKPSNDVGPVLLHDCLQNHEGSSAMMEAKGCLEIHTHLYDQFHVQLAMIYVDDDVSMRATVQWKNVDCLKNNNTDFLLHVPISKGKNKGELQD